MEGSSERRPTILVAEDVPLLRELEALYLARLGRVITASHGAEALRLARKHRPDLIVADLLMPHLDGANLCRLVKSDPQLADTPVVILTASERPEDRERSVRAGAVDVLHKPIERNTLLEAVARFFEPPRPVGQPRIPVTAPIRMHQDAQDAWGTLRNLSRGGAFVECKSELEARDTVQLEMPLPETAETLAPTAEVVWRSEGNEAMPPGVGLRFLALDGASARRLAAYIQERMQRLPRAALGVPLA